MLTIGEVPAELELIKDPGQDKVSNNEGAVALRQQGARRENTLPYATDNDRPQRTVEFGRTLADTKGPGRNNVSDNEGVDAPRQQVARRENTLLYSTDEQRRWRECSDNR